MRLESQQLKCDMGPLLCIPKYDAPVWSGSRVCAARGLPLSPAFGEAFDISAHDGLVNTIENGPLAGRSLRELLENPLHKEVLGAIDADGILQVITMDAAQTLSVQVHPDESYALRNEGDHEKTESWYILRANPGSKIMCGLTTQDEKSLREATEADELGQRFGRWISVSEGDMVLLPAGTVHALGEGIMALEVGSLGFCTYRLCDWGRGRELHIRRAFDVMKTESKPEPVSMGAFNPFDGAKHVRLVSHELFVVEGIDVRGSWTSATDGVYHILSCVGGNARIVCDEGAVELPYTRSALIPAAVKTYRIEGQCRVLQSYPVT